MIVWINNSSKFATRAPTKVTAAAREDGKYATPTETYCSYEARVPTAGVFSRDLGFFGFFGTELGFWGFCLRNWVFFFQIPNSKIGPKTPSTTPPSNSRNLIDYPPPQRNRAENSINYPPSNSRNLIDYPPSKSGRKLHQLPPPLEFTEPHRLPPPPRNRAENSINYPPPSNSGQIRSG